MTSRRGGNDLLRRKSDPGSWKLGNNESVVAAELPWGGLKVVNNMAMDFGSLPAKFTTQNLLLELFTIFERKIQTAVAVDQFDKVCNKAMRQNDPNLDHVLKVLGNVSEVCLPSVLEAVIKWYEEQIESSKARIRETHDGTQRAVLATNYLFCLMLLELLPQVHFHPADCEKFLDWILNLAFNSILTLHRESPYISNFNNVLVIEAYAEVIGALSNSHAHMVEKKFFQLLNEFRKEVPMTQATLTNILALLMSMKSYRIKTSQVSEVEQGVNFLDELATYFLEVDVKQKDLKHAIVSLLVDILLPVAAQIKIEANIPALIAFVDKLYGPALELINKKQHKLQLYPLVTCLLCISQNKFFINNWTQFLNTTLSNLKNRDVKMSKAAIETLYRLLWVYIGRNNCEGNTATRSKLESICGSIFPKGSRYIYPRDAPLAIFAKIIHFISQQKLDFVFKEIIFDLLGCARVKGNTISIIPERMNLGIRSLIIIMDGLYNNRGATLGMAKPFVPASGTMQRRKSYMLTAEFAKSINLEQYYIPCRRAFDATLRTLDSQIGKCLMLTSSQIKGKDKEDLISSDTKPKIDLFRVCIAAIPKLLPEPMPTLELIDLLIRMTVHVDEEVRNAAFQTVQTIVSDCAEWREDVIHTYIAFITNTIQDAFPALLDAATRFMIQLVGAWKIAFLTEKKNNTVTPSNYATSAGRGTTIISNSAGVIVATTSVSNAHSAHPSGTHSDVCPTGLQYSVACNLNNIAVALHNVEGLALMLLCQTKLRPKVYALLKDVKLFLTLLDYKESDKPVLTMLDEATPYVLNKFIEHVPLAERQSLNQDFISAYEKISSIEADETLVNSDKGNEYMRWDAWACALSGYCEHRFLLSQCPTAVGFAWPALYTRLIACNQFVDPNNVQNESRASLLRSSRSKATASSLCGEPLDQGSYLSLWQKYLVMAFALTQPPAQSASFLARSFSPNGNLDSFDSVRSMTSSLRSSQNMTVNCTHLFQKVDSMMRLEQTRDMRDSVALGIGSTNPACFDLLLDEFNTRNILREVLEKKVDSNVRRRKRRDLLRLQVLRVVEIAMFRGLLEASTLVDPHTRQLSPVLVDIISSIRASVDTDYVGRDMTVITPLQLHLAKTVTLLINSVPLERRKNLLPPEKKRELFKLFFNWFNKQNRDIGDFVKPKAVHALCAVLCCGQIDSLSTNEERNAQYNAIDHILKSEGVKGTNINEDILSTILHLNDNNTFLFDWVVKMCYKENKRVSRQCFKALVMLFTKREDVSERHPMVTLCQVYAADSDPSVRRSVGMLMQILRRQFLDGNTFDFQNSQANTSSSSHDKSGTSEKLSVMLLEETKICGRLFPTSQNVISRQLAMMYPSITLSIISDLIERLQNAQPEMQASILTVLKYWIESIELVDPNCELPVVTDGNAERGYGSAEVTFLLLNNMLYISNNFDGEHRERVATLWKTLVTKFPGNLPIIVQYLFVTISLASDQILSVVKRIARYLLEASGERFISLLASQLPLVTEQFKMTLVRSTVEPFFKWQPAQNDSDDLASPGDEMQPDGFASRTNTANAIEEKLNTSDMLPKELPMPYGGFRVDVQPLLGTNQPIIYFSKSNLALFLLTDLIGCDDDFTVNWGGHATTILHICVLCLDYVRPIIARHARMALINTCLLFAPENTNTSKVASLLLNNLIEIDRFEILEKFSGTEEDVGNIYNNMVESTLTQKSEEFADTLQSEYRQMLLHSKASFSSHTDLLQALVYCLSKRIDKPFWTGPDQLSCFVHHLSVYLSLRLPSLFHLWNEMAASTALSINNRHMAGRSFQIMSALSQNPTPWIGRMLSRLAELVSDPNEDTQLYITNMMMCLQSLVSYVRCETTEIPISADGSVASPAGHNRSISYTPAFLSQNQSHGSSTIPVSPASPITMAKSPTSSISPMSKKDARHSMLIENEMHASHLTSTPLNRSKSAATLKVDGYFANEEAVGSYTQLLTIAVAMLDSNIENEYFLALNLLDKLFETLNRDTDLCIQRLEKTIKKLDWSGFSGVVGLVSRGAMYPACYETTISLLNKCIFLLHEPVIASPNSFALIVITVLPYLLTSFDNPTPLCASTAKVISTYCTEQLPEALKEYPELSANDHSLGLLSTMMLRYEDRTFARDRFQWTKCVINYLIDAVKPNPVQLVVFLCEMLEMLTRSDKPPSTHSHPNMQTYILHIVYLIISHGDLSEASPVPINAQMVRVVSKHICSINHKETARILKTVVDQWNSISVNQVSPEELGGDKRKPHFDLYVGTGSQNASSSGSPAVGSNAISPPTPRKFTSSAGASGTNQAAASALGSGVPLPTASCTTNVDSLRRQNITAQSKARERLIGLLTASGMQVGLPKSSSFIFSQSTNDLYHDGLCGNGVPNGNGTLQAATSNSAYSSSERISHLDELEAMSGSSLAVAGNEPSTDSFPRVFKEFDFLENERDTISESTESGFGWYSTFRPQRRMGSNVGGDEQDETLGDDFINPGDGDDEEEDDIDEESDRADIEVRLRSGVSRHSLSSGNTLKKRVRRPMSGASESNDMLSDRTPVQSEKQSDESCPSCPNTDEEEDDIEDDIEEDDELEVMDEVKSQKSHLGASSIDDTGSTTYPIADDILLNNLDTASSIQCRSEFSLQNTPDFSSRKAPIYLECNHHSSGQVEQVWMTLVNEVAGDQDGEMTAHCILLFSQLFRECCAKLSGLLRDASHMMTTSAASVLSPGSNGPANTHRDVSGYFIHALDVLAKVADCPFLFVTAPFLRSTNLLQSQRFALYELREHYETFIERREQCIRALNSMKSALKLLMIGGSTNSSSFGGSVNHEIDLNKCLHKLFFQLLQMLDKLHDVIKAVQTSTGAQEYDLSPAVLCLQRELLACISDLPASESRVSTTSLNVMPRGDQHYDTLVLHLTNKQYKNAIMSLRQLRSQYGSEFGCCDHMDVDVLLIQFCRSQVIRTWAIVGSLQTLDHSCAQLKEISMQFAALVRSVISDATASVRSSRVSSVTESAFSVPTTSTQPLI